MFYLSVGDNKIRREKIPKWEGTESVFVFVNFCDEERKQRFRFDHFKKNIYSEKRQLFCRFL